MAGIGVTRLKNSPKQTLLGLRTRPIRTVIDVGANSGQFAKYISVFFPKAELYCFEPLPEPFEALQSWAKTQNGRVRPFNFAIGDVEGETGMFLHEKHNFSSSLLATTDVTEQYYPVTKEQKRISIKQVRLDVALYDVNADLTSGILIKLDVQGYENRVIAGGGNVFAKAAACILEVNIDSLYKGQAEFFELLTMLDAIGYRYVGNLEQSYGEDGHCIFLDAVFINTTESAREPA